MPFADKALLHDLRAPLLSGEFLGEDKAEILVELAGCVQASERPEMRFRKMVLVAKRNGLAQEVPAKAAPTPPILDDKPSEVGEAGAEVLAVDPDHPDNMSGVHGRPDLIGRSVQAPDEFSQSRRDDALENMAEPNGASIVARMHLDSAPDQASSVTGRDHNVRDCLCFRLEDGQAEPGARRLASTSLSRVRRNCDRPSLSARVRKLKRGRTFAKTPAAYSTVTDFARLRGWSASLPMITAV